MQQPIFEKLVIKAVLLGLGKLLFYFGMYLCGAAVAIVIFLILVSVILFYYPFCRTRLRPGDVDIFRIIGLGTTLGYVRLTSSYKEEFRLEYFNTESLVLIRNTREVQSPEEYRWMLFWINYRADRRVILTSYPSGALFRQEWVGTFRPTEIALTEQQLKNSSDGQLVHQAEDLIRRVRRDFERHLKKIGNT